MKTITLAYLEEHINQIVSIKIKHSTSQEGLQAVTTFKIIKGILIEINNDKNDFKKCTVTLNVKGKKVIFPFGKIITIEK
jgi:hypothetical protein